MVKKIILVDFENVHSEGLAGVDALSENDEVVIFHSVNADTITFEMMHKLMFSKAKLSYYKVRRGGRNALDFQMSSYLGYLVNTHAAEAEFYLISKDAGFDFVTDFWESGNINVKPKIKRFYTIKAVLANKTVKSVDKATETHKIKPAETSKENSGVKLAEVAAETLAEILAAEVTEVNKEEAKVKKVVKIPKNPAVKKAAKTIAMPEEDIAEDAIVMIEPAPNAPAPAETVDMDIETVAEVDKLLSESKSSHELYISMVKRFGQKKGVEIYRNIKSKFSAQRTG